MGVALTNCVVLFSTCLAVRDLVSVYVKFTWDAQAQFGTSHRDNVLHSQNHSGPQKPIIYASLYNKMFSYKRHSRVFHKR